MGFLAGTMLWGALAAGIPVILHLTGRAKPVLHRFAALRFLHRSHKTTSRALRIKHLLLLLLRILAIALLAVTLARPVWPWSSPAALPGQLHGDYVLVLDASLSMACRAGETSRFERAQAQAAALLDLLAPDARVALAVAAEEAESVQGRLTLDHGRVREAVARAVAGGQALDLGRALRAAQAIFQRENRPDQEGAARAAVFFTDLQAHAFAAAAHGNMGEDAGLPPLVIVDVGEGEERNAAVLDAELPQYAVASGQTLALSATVKPLATDRTCVVDLFVDDVRIAQKPLEPNGAAAVDVRFDFPAGLPGVHAGRLRVVQHDALAADQERTFAYDAGRPPRTLIVERPAEGQAEGQLGSGHFLRAALATPSAGAASGLAAEVVAAKDVKPDQFKDHRVVILADPGELNDAVWRALQRFVQEGGGLFVWLGPNCNPEALAPMGYSTYSRNLGLLPGHLGKQVTLAADKPQTVRIAQPDHPVLARFTPQVRGVLRAVKVRQYVSVEPEAADPNAGVVLTLSGGAPLLLEKSYGAGRVLLCATGPTAASSSMVVQGEAEALLTLVLDACRLLSGGGDETRARLGRPLVLTIFDPPADGVVRWTPPNAAQPGTLYVEPEAPGSEAASKPPDKNAPAAPARRAKLLVPPLKDAGVHRFAWRPAGQSADRVQLVAVNPAASESDLARIADADALEALKPWDASIVKEVAQAPRFAAKGAEGREWPIPMLLAVLALLAVESFLSNRLYKGTPGDAEAEGEAGGAP